MTIKFSRSISIPLWWSFAGGAILALIAGKGTLPRISILLLTLIGGGCASRAVWEHGWLEIKKGRAVLAGICTAVFWLAVMAWPTPPDEALRFKIFAECEPAYLPVEVKPDTSVYTVEPFPISQDKGGGGLGRYSSSNGKIAWPMDGVFPVQVFRCETRNYGSEAVVNVDLKLGVTFLQALRIPTSHGYQENSGKETLSRDWLVPIPRIDVGKDGAFIFYVHNTTKQYIRASLPDTVTVELVGEPRRKVVALSHSKTISFMMLRPLSGN